MEGAEKKGFVCDSGRKPADYNHASACRAPRFAIYDTRDNWDFFFFIFFVPSFFPPSSRFIFQLRFFLQCTSILFWSTHRKKEENLKRTARVNEDGSIGLFSRDESAETVWEKNDPQGWIIHLTFWWSIIFQDRCSFMRLSRRFFLFGFLLLQLMADLFHCAHFELSYPLVSDDIKNVRHNILSSKCWR